MAGILLNSWSLGQNSNYLHLFVAQIQLHRRQQGDDTRNMRAKQLDEGIADTLVSVHATDGRGDELQIPDGIGR